MRSPRPAGVSLLAVALLAGCGAGPDADEILSGDDPAPLISTAAFSPDEEPPVEFARGGAEATPRRYGIGRPAGRDEIARLDIDIMPDGAGLPAGSGTPSAGAATYAAKCAACHGAEGTGASAGALVAPGAKHAFTGGDDPAAFSTRTIGNYWPYATTLFDFIRRAMPFDRPGSLTDDEVYALVAWLLWKNEIVTEDAVMDAATLPSVEMPARDRFTPDDRLTSTRVR